ncbi:hypothetical protein HY990_05720 [Candidatus Micrarchaeota archaeon]|nr:hypothetical protein [Candidatus Micrarchaeota archaeon]
MKNLLFCLSMLTVLLIGFGCINQRHDPVDLVTAPLIEGSLVKFNVSSSPKISSNLSVHPIESSIENESALSITNVTPISANSTYLKFVDIRSDGDSVRAHFVLFENESQSEIKLRFGQTIQIDDSNVTFADFNATSYTVALIITNINGEQKVILGKLEDAQLK